MRFTEEKTYQVEIVEAFIAKPKFAQDEGAFDIAILVRDAEGHEDFWRGEVSREWGKGNFSDRTQAQITMLTLENIGWQHGVKFEKLDTLVGTKTTATVKQKNGYFNISFLGSSGNKPERLDDASLKARLANVAAFFPSDSGQAAPANDEWIGDDTAAPAAEPPTAEDAVSNPFM